MATKPAGQNIYSTKIIMVENKMLYSTRKSFSDFIKESFKAIFIGKNLGKEAAKEHRQRISSKEQSK